MHAIGRTSIILALAALGCGGTVAVTQTYTPQAAAHVQSEKFVPVAIVRDGHRTPVPNGARVENGRIVLQRVTALKLAPADVIQEDELGRIVAVRSPGDPPVVTRFVPGTARSPADSAEVRGELADDATTIALRPGDAVEMRGHLGADGTLPNGARVESSRSTAFLVAGAVVFVLSYAPTLYVGAGSPRSSDRVLEVPIAGPWLDLATRPSCVEPVLPFKPPVDPCIEETASRVALVTSGGLQGLAAVLTVIGLPVHSHLAEGDDRGVGARTKPRVAIVPTANGAAALGTF